MGIKIITDSTSYLPKHSIEELNITVLSLNVAWGNDSIREVDISNRDFYKRMAQYGIPTSSQPSIGEMYDEMANGVERGDEICCILLSSEMSGTYNTANIAKKMVIDAMPNAKIIIIDSKTNCMQLGFAVLTAARAARAGASLAEVERLTRENLRRSRFLFIPDNLEYLRKGGRIGNASALIGNLLKIIPVLTVENGKTTILSKVRTKKNAVEKMVDTMLHDVKDAGLGEIIVHHIDSQGEAAEVVRMLHDKVDAFIEIVDIGPVIGLHVGPGAIGIAYYTKKDFS